MTASHKFGVFAIVFAIAFPVIYVIATELNLAAFTYHAALGQIGLGPDKPRNGPAMYWYGWIATAAVTAAILATIAAYLPDNLTRKLPAASAWMVPLLAMATAAGLMINMYFTR